MKNIENEFVHDVGIRQIASIDTLEAGIRLTQFPDDLHHLERRVLPHGSRIFTKLPGLTQVELCHQPLLRLLWRIICQHQLGEEIEEHRHSGNRCIGFRILVEIEDDFVHLHHILIGNSRT